MPNWRDEYLDSLRESEKHSPINLDLIQICSQYADRIAALEAEKAVLEAKTVYMVKPTGKEVSTPSPNADPEVAQLQLSLAEALRSQGSLESRVRKAEDELQNLRAKSKIDAKTIKTLTVERNALFTKLNDREHELREKRKLVEDVQDEMITLNLQVAVAEKERDKVKKENKELVDRWMKRMAQEAEAMNLANEPIFDKRR